MAFFIEFRPWFSLQLGSLEMYLLVNAWQECHLVIRVGTPLLPAAGTPSELTSVIKPFQVHSAMLSVMGMALEAHVSCG
jgi:hypothetical protein